MVSGISLVLRIADGTCEWAAPLAGQGGGPTARQAGIFVVEMLFGQMRWWGDDHVLARLDPSPSNYDAIADFAGAFFRTRDLLVKATRAVSVGDARHLLSGIA